MVRSLFLTAAWLFPMRLVVVQVQRYNKRLLSSSSAMINPRLCMGVFLIIYHLICISPFASIVLTIFFTSFAEDKRPKMSYLPSFFGLTVESSWISTSLVKRVVSYFYWLYLNPCNVFCVWSVRCNTLQFITHISYSAYRDFAVQFLATISF